jgi:hypothetical protein
VADFRIQPRCLQSSRYTLHGKSRFERASIVSKTSRYVGHPVTPKFLVVHRSDDGVTHGGCLRNRFVLMPQGPKCSFACFPRSGNGEIVLGLRLLPTGLDGLRILGGCHHPGRSRCSRTTKPLPINDLGLLRESAWISDPFGCIVLSSRAPPRCGPETAGEEFHFWPTPVTHRSSSPRLRFYFLRARLLLGVGVRSGSEPGTCSCPSSGGMVRP